MSLIEKAAERLDQLRRAGVEVPAGDGGRAEPRAAAEPAAAAAGQDGPPRGTARLEIDVARLAAEGFVTPADPRSRTAEEFRVLKRPLIANASAARSAPGGHPNLVMVTSALPGEGKTFCAVNLAMSIAMEMDRTVLLVDADVARPSVPRVLGLPELPGLFDVLEGRVADVSEVLNRTNVEKLVFLSSGTLNPRASELLASDSMAALLDELAGRYSDRIIIFDSPPLLVTTEAHVLASHMGQVIVVAHSEKTLRSDVKRALATIQSCPIRMMVLNQARPNLRSPYGQGYGYGYGYGK
ncbi:MAG: XrtA-associated tyrosine autokinase [Lysobacter sp.]|nr:XrtA-associated tyrosine autokinase [Lysobacter sp.]